jgi:hypothetical protein
MQFRLDGRNSLAADRRRSRGALQQFKDQAAALVKPAVTLFGAGEPILLQGV